MADYTFTAANVKQLSGDQGEGVAAVDLAAGDWVYENAAGQMDKARSATVILATVKGVVLHTAFAGQKVRFAKSGVVRFGGGTPGEQAHYASISSNAGKFNDLVLNATGYMTLLGYWLDTTDLNLTIISPALQWD